MLPRGNRDVMRLPFLLEGLLQQKRAGTRADMTMSTSNEKPFGESTSGTIKRQKMTLIAGNRKEQNRSDTRRWKK